MMANSYNWERLSYSSNVPVNDYLDYQVLCPMEFVCQRETKTRNPPVVRVLLTMPATRQEQETSSLQPGDLSETTSTSRYSFRCQRQTFRSQVQVIFCGQLRTIKNVVKLRIK